MRIHAYAKINLALQVLGVTRDNMHELRMIMQEIDLYDIINITKSKEINVEIPGVDEKNNTVYAAAAAFFGRSGIEGGADISVKKNIPMQSGLGGGSADGAAVLRALNEMHGDPLSSHELLILGNSVGADVPFCLMGGCCVAEGTGDKLRRIENNLDVYYVIVKPEAGVSTGKAFALFDERATAYVSDFAACERAIVGGDISGFTPINDLQGVAAKLCPQIDTTIDNLKKHTDIAFMTGSGSACVGIFESEMDARRCAGEADGFAAVCRGRHYEQL